MKKIILIVALLSSPLLEAANVQGEPLEGTYQEQVPVIDMIDSMIVNDNPDEAEVDFLISVMAGLDQDNLSKLNSYISQRRDIQESFRKEKENFLTVQGNIESLEALHPEAVEINLWRKDQGLNPNASIKEMIDNIMISKEEVDESEVDLLMSLISRLNMEDQLDAVSYLNDKSRIKMFMKQHEKVQELRESVKDLEPLLNNLWTRKMHETRELQE